MPRKQPPLQLKSTVLEHAHGPAHGAFATPHRAQCLTAAPCRFPGGDGRHAAWATRRRYRDEQGSRPPPDYSGTADSFDRRSGGTDGLVRERRAGQAVQDTPHHSISRLLTGASFTDRVRRNNTGKALPIFKPHPFTSIFLSGDFN